MSALNEVKVTHSWELATLAGPLVDPDSDLINLNSMKTKPNTGNLT